MHKVRTSLAALLAVLVLAVGVLFTATPAMAEGEGASFTVSATSDAAGQKVFALKMFDETKDGNNHYGYTLTAQFEKFFTEAASNKYGCSGKSGTELSNAAYDYVSKLTDAERVTFAAEARTYVKANSASFTATEATFATSGQTTSATLNGLDHGYYLMYAGTDLATPAADSNAMLQHVNADSTEVELKAEFPTVDKTVTGDEGTSAGNNGGSVSVGDELTYTLASAVPDTSGYSKYTFKFVDTLSKGLTLSMTDGKPNVTVTVGDNPGTTLTVDDDYTATVTNGVSDSTVLTVDLTKFMDKIIGGTNQTPAGTKITVTYKATINENAVVVGDANGKDVDLVYSNDPSNPSSTDTSEDKTYSYLFGFTIDKFTSEDGAYDSDVTHLAGAQFEIKKGGEYASATKLNFTEVSEGDATNEAEYRYDEDGTATITSPESGKINIWGLEEGTYWIEETTAPDGYNKANPIKVVISATYAEDGQITGHTMTYGDNSTPAQHPDHIIPVYNKDGILIPGTGGMGTVVFTVIGVVAIAGGAIWYVSRRRATSSGAHTA